MAPQTHLSKNLFRVSPPGIQPPCEPHRTIPSTGEEAAEPERSGLSPALPETSPESQSEYSTLMDQWLGRLTELKPETKGHSERVTVWMGHLARHVGLDTEQVQFVQWGARLHDIGNIAVPVYILEKEGPLTVEEWVLLRRHPALARRMMLTHGFPEPVTDIPYCHHEKWDGTGYPRGLKGKTIPWTARLFAVVDVYEALRAERSYRSRWPEQTVREYLQEEAGRHFDPAAVTAFLEVLEANRSSPASDTVSSFAD